MKLGRTVWPPWPSWRCSTAAPSLEASMAMVAKMGLRDMTANAAHIFRGTVLDVEQSSLTVGGGELPVVVYTLRVDEAFKGDFGSGKDAAGDGDPHARQHQGEPAAGASGTSPPSPTCPGSSAGTTTCSSHRAERGRPVDHGRPRPGHLPRRHRRQQEMAANELATPACSPAR